MRAYQIILFLILLQASIGFVNQIDFFGDQKQFYTTPQNEWTTKNVTQLGQYATEGNETNIVDTFAQGVMWGWEMLILFIQIIFSIVIVLPALIKVFAIPWQLASFIQIGIWVIYVWGLVQFKSGKATKYMD